MAIHRSLKRFLRIIHASKIGFLAMALCLPGYSQGTEDTIGDAGSIPPSEDILCIANHTKLDSLDPQTATSIPAGIIIRGFSEGLLLPSTGATSDLRLGMAETHKVSDDKKTYTFTLRDNILWSNGDPVKAQDFVNAVEYGLLKSTKSLWTSFYFHLKGAQKYYDAQDTTAPIPFRDVGVKATNEKTLTLTLECPVPFFLSLLTHHCWSPIHPSNIKRDGAEKITGRNDIWTNPGDHISNGPYKLTSKMTQDGKEIVVLEKNPNYWDKDKVAIPKIWVYQNIDADAQEQMFDKGQLHITSNVPPGKIEPYSKQGTLKIANTLETGFLYFNCRKNIRLDGEDKKNPLNDSRVRQALSLAINRREIGEIRKRGMGFEAYALVPPGIEQYPRRDLLPTESGGPRTDSITTENYSHDQFFQEDIAYAKKLLANADYKDGTDFPKLTLTYLEKKQRLCEEIKRAWEENLKITVELKSLDWSEFKFARSINPENQNPLQIFWGEWVAEYSDQTAFLDLFRTESRWNYGGWESADYDTLLIETAANTSTEERMNKLMEAEKLLITTEAACAPLYYGSTINLVSNNINGWRPHPLEQHLLKDLSFKETTK